MCCVESYLLSPTPTSPLTSWYFYLMFPRLRSLSLISRTSLLDHQFSRLCPLVKVGRRHFRVDSCFLTHLSAVFLKRRQQDAFYFERDVIWNRTCPGSSCLGRSALLCLNADPQAASRKDPKYWCPQASALALALAQHLWHLAPTGWLQQIPPHSELEQTKTLWFINKEAQVEIFR